MRAINFKESNAKLSKPNSMNENQCNSLNIYKNNDGTCVSCWRASFWQRIKFLFHGKIWLGVYSGETQPPVWVECAKTVFIEE